MKRRAFLKNSTVFTLPAFLGGFDMAAMPSSLMTTLINGDSDKVLVLIDLNGGNDGLNTIIPYTNDIYHNSRPKLSISKEKHGVANNGSICGSSDFN